MKRLAIHRHPECARCARYARVHRALDWLGRLEPTTAAPPGAPLTRGKIAVVDLATGERLRGAAAMAALARQVPAYWPLLVALRVPALRRRFAAEVEPGEAETCQPARGGADRTS